MSTAGEATNAARAAYRQYSRASSNSSSENLPPRTLARLAREVRDLQKNPPDGLRMVVDDDSGLPSNMGELMVELDGPQGTPYEGKFFLLKLVFSSEFPSTPPRGFFLTKIYHPNVDMSTGAICVNTLKKDWTAETTMSHVLAVIRCLLIVPFPESSLNDEAGKMFMESYEEFARRARLMADVHGRSHSIVLAKSDRDEALEASSSHHSEDSGSGGSVGRGILQKSSDNTSLRNHNQASGSGMSSVGGGVGGTKKVVSKGQSSMTGKKLSKKKSLKRL